ncbi:activating signal cointegrator 1 complex subunit 2-like isoform X2 [Gigantopelta aegis]|nr:activating signal cointegrator 1 complex subunit 2-like isoform X2 [Gigantopelta aegis]XP_041373442.1 activating signal cointegrator 1 complex subunit 2-like isoform X2 [Gigantopelta aegis]
MACLRLATHKESKDHFITPKVFGEILYENFIFDVPKLLDMCVLYGKGNGTLLTKMLTNIFTQQPAYLDDLRTTIPTILQVFDSIRETCGMCIEGSEFSPMKLSSVFEKEPRLVTMPTQEFQDIVLYIADTALTLAMFVEIYPPACQVFQEFEFVQKLASFYECIIPEIKTAIGVRNFDTLSQKKTVKLNVRQAKMSLQKVFRLIVQHTCLQPIIENSGGDVERYVEEFLHIMTAVLGEKRFLADYEGKYNFQEDVEILCQSSYAIDETRFHYIHDAINTAFATYGRRKKPMGGQNAGGRTSPDGSPSPLEEQGAVGGACVSSLDKPGAVGGAYISPMEDHGAVGGACDGGSRPEGGAEGGTCSMADVAGSFSVDQYQVDTYETSVMSALEISSSELDSLISSVKDLLPGLGEGFIEIVLEEFNYNLERVVNTLLEDKLPPSLDEIDRDLQREVRKTPSPSVLDSRRNIYDDDEFDIFRRDDVDKTKIHIGKRNEKVSLDDKDDLKGLRATYEAYGSQDVPSMYDKMAAYDYDDEYDDTYDTNNIGADDADSADELTSRRPFTMPRVLMPKAERRVRLASDSEDSDEGKSREQFVSDPAKLREAAEQRRQSKLGRGRGGHQQTAPPKYDVKGKPKGQGQEDTVLRNRQFKEKNKSFRGNHNRRLMADKKKAKGMF